MSKRIAITAFHNLNKVPKSTSSSIHHFQPPSRSSSSSSNYNNNNNSNTNTIKKSLIGTKNQDVHSNMQLSKSWRNKPLFRRQGDVRFRTGLEAANLLVNEAKRRDEHEKQFIDSVESTMQCLSPVFERNPRYAFVAKQLMEPERFIQFRVPWLDDTGVIRMNRGYRIQYSSSLGPYEGALHFGSHINGETIKSLGFDQVFSNGLTGYDLGAAVGGSDINPFDKSEAEIQRFCQSYMTELEKYIGPDVDLPIMGMGVGEKEMGYLFGQYKRINVSNSSAGRQFLSFTNPTVSTINAYRIE
jgi:glutamate dehydrogenase (NADP+)